MYGGSLTRRVILITRRGEYMATAQYDRENTRRINLKLNNKTDADIIEKLEDIKDIIGIQGYIKRLIRDDIKRQEKKETGK